MGMVDSVTRRYGEGLADQVRDRLARVRRNAESEMGLISELLELSRIRTRRQDFVEANVSDVVRGAADRIAEELEAKGVRLILDEEWPVVWCERARIAQVFQNLIDNAVKYMGERDDARIEVGWREDPGRYVFHVRDNGVGIAPEDVEKVFRVFRRAKSAATTGAEGKGVGLAAVKAIAEAYDGEAWVESELSRGSTFYFSLAKARVKRRAQAASDADLSTE
jgi:signal transduction histidine kinase